MTRVKICGITNVADACAAADAGADLIGLNFWPGTPRCVTMPRAREIADAVRGRVQVVAVFVDALEDEIRRTADAVGADFVQLHGAESAELAESLKPLRVIKAFHVAGLADLAQLAGFPAEVCLLDARVERMPGGTGRTIDWQLAREASRHGPILLAGGLTPENVAEAVRVARPWGVDTASGVERAPGIKDARKVANFVENVRRAEREMKR